MAAFFLRMVVAEGLFYLFVPRAQYREKTRTKLVDGTMREKLGRMVAVPVSPSDAQSRFILCRNDMLCAIKETLMTPSGMSRPDVSFINDWVMDPTDALELLSFEFLHYGDPDVAWLGTDGIEEAGKTGRTRSFGSRFNVDRTNGSKAFKNIRSASHIHDWHR